MRALLISFGVIFTWFPMIFDPYVGFCTFGKWYPLSYFIGLLWQRQSFTSQLSLDSWMCLLEMSLGRWGLLIGSIWGQDNGLSSEVGGAGM